MINHRTRLAALAVAVTAAVALPASAQAAQKAHTLRFFDRLDRITVTHADGTVVENPSAEPLPGDRLDVYSSELAGTHQQHAKKRSGTNHLVCTFGETPVPDCISNVAFGGSILVFQGDPGKVIGGTGRFLHASGRVTSNQSVPGGNDIVAKIRF
jgi:hypothetical protein